MASHPARRRPALSHDSGQARYTFDCRRARTPLQHLDDDYASSAPPNIRNERHLLEWAEHVERLQPGTTAFTNWVDEQKRGAFMVHNHVWIVQDILRLLQHLASRYEIRYALQRWQNTSIFGDEFTLILKKSTAPLRREQCARYRIATIAAAIAHPIHESCSRFRRLLRRVVRR